jgi:hypothetical protein
LFAAFAACARVTSVASGSSTSAGGAMADGGLDAGPPDAAACGVFGANVIGQPCPPDCESPACCDQAFAAACVDAGGLAPPACGCNLCGGWEKGVTCAAPPTLESGKFRCYSSTCNVGEVCVRVHPQCDACESYHCIAPPGACNGTTTCGCVKGNVNLDDAGFGDPSGWMACAGADCGGGPCSNNWDWLSCEADSAGNPTVYVGCNCGP